VGEFDRRTFLAGSAALGAGGILAACGSSGSSKAGGSTSGGTKGTPGVSNATPKKGGTLNIGVEAEDNGFNPTIASWDVTGLMYGACVFDSVTYVASDGSVKPYLAQSMTPNADYTQWTIKLRTTPIHFHDGTVCDSSAIVGSLEMNVHSAQNGLALTNIDSITNPDASTVVVKMKTPWIAFPYYLSQGSSIGMVLAPAMVKASDGGDRNPVGTGPFKFKEWVPNDHATFLRNDSYWQPGFPHVDTVIFHPIPDHQSRENSLKAGQIDIMHTDDTQTAVDFMNNASYQYLNDLHNNSVEHEQDFLMINTAQAPLDNLTVRQALAYSLDRQKVINTLYNGISPNADQPFSTGSPYFVSDSGYPTYNLAKAQSLMKQAAQQIGGPVKFELSIINDAKDLAVTQLVQGMFTAAGAQVNIVQIQQSQYIVQALLGQYAVRGWRQFAAADPDQNYVWWHSSTALPIGKIALNFARNKDPQIDSALETGRTSSDKTARVQAYQTVAKRFGADVPYLWINQAYWSVIAKPNVMNFDNAVTPEGTKGLSMTGGYFNPRFIWLA
jgi:peptide/nickel transport system substrate-binding protein